MSKKSEENFISPVSLEEQENLNLARLKMLQVENNLSLPARPHSSFIELMNWVYDNFNSFLKNRLNINKFVHNRILIDGQFLQFCEEKNIKVKTLYKDSIVSWKTENNFEKFFAQGIFLISGSNLEFIHSNLFHKGNQNEDEISFFCLVSESNYEAYIKLRNEFDAWVLQRDRSNLHIRVIDGEDMPYTKDQSWNDLFLPESIKKELKQSVESFLNNKDFYLKNKIPWKTGILMFGEPGCHIKGTPILLYSGNWVNVEDVKVGDLLMGPDSKPREVLKLARGKEEMYKVVPNKGKSFIVNKNHILHLRHSTSKQEKKSFPSYSNIKVSEYLNLSISLKEKLKLVKSSKLEFNSDRFKGSNNYELDPYILGVWLGDGTTGKPEITSADPEIIKAVENYTIKNNLNFRIRKTKSKAKTLIITHRDDGENIFTHCLRKLGIFDKKSIPEKYITADVNARLQLLAGIIDTDGHYNLFSWDAMEKYKKIGKRGKGCFDLTLKDFEMSEQIGKIVLSLGLGFTITKCTKTIKSIGFSGEYYRMSIYGDIFNIPTKLPRKMALQGRPNKDCKFVGIKSIEPVGVDDFYGFTIDQDHLYVMDDFWISHNCGKSSAIRTIISNYNFKPVTIVPGANDDAVREAFSYAEEQSPSLLYFEDLDSLLETTMDASSFLNLMDGISAKNGLFIIATANNFSKLKSNITDRPSRFDRKFEIPLPDEHMSCLYLKKWFGNLIDSKKLKELAKYSVRYKFSYAYLKELYISSMFEALANNRKVPTAKDISKSLDRLMKDKNILKSGSISTERYFSK